jgi:hypothetical protein
MPCLLAAFQEVSVLQAAQIQHVQMQRGALLITLSELIPLSLPPTRLRKPKQEV